MLFGRKMHIYSAPPMIYDAKRPTCPSCPACPNSPHGLMRCLLCQDDFVVKAAGQIIAGAGETKDIGFCVTVNRSFCIVEVTVFVDIRMEDDGIFDIGELFGVQ